MQFGYFDEQNREYVITRPDTPQSWSNYLGSTDYGAIITNNAGGYGFYKSGARGRFLRLRFNSIPMDQPGRYFYLRDRENGDYWSASWQPVGKPLHLYQSTCRHGTGYTSIESRYSDISTRSTYFVPLGETFEYWRLSVTNQSNVSRSLSVFTYCEFTNQWDTQQDQVNLQYSLFIVRGERTNEGLLRISIQDNLSLQPENENKHDNADHIWMGLVGSPVSAFDTNRESFIGTYGGYHNPVALESGSCANSQAYGDNACGTFQTDVDLAPGESKEILILLGIGDAHTSGKTKMKQFGSICRADEEFDRLKTYWHSHMNHLKVVTPDEELNHTINTWGIYNCLVNFAWSRSASLVYNGERDGLGFRDSVQDVLGVVAEIPEEARQRLELMLSGQVSNGGAMQVVNPFDHHPGTEKIPNPEQFRSDDCLWFFNAIPEYVFETGDVDFYQKIIPYADSGKDTVYEHLRRALEFNLERTGKNGLPCGLLADWNDCLRLGYHGESLFVAFQVRYGLKVFLEIATLLGKKEDAAWAAENQALMDANISDCSWDGDWFIWAIDEKGNVYGTRNYEEGQIYLNTQVWSVISGAATPEQAETCMKAVKEKLATPYGLTLNAPPFRKTSPEVMRAVVYNAGIKENAGIFNHTQGWAVIAECLLGHGDQAYEYWRASMPAAYNTHAEIRQAEPYVQAQTTYSTCSPRPGNTRTSWLTGAASWSYYAATHFMLGLRPELEGMRLDPCIPQGWDGFSARRSFRNCTLNIDVRNPAHIQSGIRKLSINGKVIEGNLIPKEYLKGEIDIVAELDN